MGKIIKLDTSHNKLKAIKSKKSTTCEHKQVIAYTIYRTVRCVFCGVELDPFDVLVDMLKSYIPPEANDLENTKLLREVKKREETKSDKVGNPFNESASKNEEPDKD